MRITGKLKPFDADYQGAGYTRMRTPFLLLENDFTGVVTVEIREDRYRVTLKDIDTYGKGDQITSQGQRGDIEDAIMKNNGELRSYFYNEASEILEFTLIEYFTIKKREVKW